MEEKRNGGAGFCVCLEMMHRLRYAARLLRKTPGFTVTAVSILGICLGAHLAIFAVLDGVVLRALPFPHAERLVTIFNTYPRAGVMRDGASRTNYYERRGKIAAFESLSIYRLEKGIVGEGGGSEQEQVTQVSPEFFDTLGVRPAMGRTFTEAETSYENDGVAIVSEAFWRRHFGGDAWVLGKTVRLNGRAKTVVGVLPGSFRFLSSDAQLYVPLASRPEERAPSQRHSGGNVTQMIARLRAGVGVVQAQAEIDRQNNALEVDDPQGKMMAEAGFRSLVKPLQADHVAEVRPVLWLLEGAVLFLLVLGGVNLANLLLVRAGGRAKEMAVRQALGANGMQLASEVAAEVLLLTVAGGALGVALGAVGIELLRLLGSEHLPLGTRLAFDGRTALMGLAATMATGVVLTIPLVWFHLRHQMASGLQLESRSSTSNRRLQMVRHGFVAAQIAVAVVMLAGAGLLTLSLKHALETPPGFQASHVLTAQLSLVGAKYPTARSGLNFVERLVGALGQQPGVASAGVANNVPFSGYSGMSAATVEGYTTRPGESPHGTYSYGVGGDYFGAMGFTLREGRFLTGDDSRSRQRVCVVDEDFARFYWPQTSALGRRLYQGSGQKDASEAFTVVGVVGRVKQAGLTDEGRQGAVYYPYLYRPENTFYVVARGAGAAGAQASALRRVVEQMDPELAVSNLRTMDGRIDDSLFVRRSPALLALVFGFVALLLTVIGTYGVLSYSVAQRQKEIGIRMAVGARPGQIRSYFLRVAIRLVVIGSALGGAAAWMLSRVMEGLLFQVNADGVGLMLATAGGLLIVVVFLACLLPAERAARVSPMKALG